MSTRRSCHSMMSFPCEVSLRIFTASLITCGVQSQIERPTATPSFGLMTMSMLTLVHWRWVMSAIVNSPHLGSLDHSTYRCQGGRRRRDSPPLSKAHSDVLGPTRPAGSHSGRSMGSPPSLPPLCNRSATCVQACTLALLASPLRIGVSLRGAAASQLLTLADLLCTCSVCDVHEVSLRRCVVQL